MSEYTQMKEKILLDKNDFQKWLGSLNDSQLISIIPLVHAEVMKRGSKK